MPFIKKEFWWIRGFDFPHVQFTVIGFISLLLALFIYNDFIISHFIILALVILGLGYKLFIIYPYTPFHALVVPNSSGDKKVNELSILTSNVFMENINYDGFLNLIREINPDVVFMLETDKKWQESIKNYMDEHFPFQILHPLDNTYGLLFYSKLKIDNDKIRFLIEDDVPSITTDLCFKNGDRVKFIGLHPKPPSPTQNETSTPRDAELIIAGREARASAYPVIVAGDMNDVAWSHTTRLFARISGLLDLRIGRGFYNTFHANHPLLRWPLDHIFVSHHFQLISMRRLKNFNSDHFPIYAHLSLEYSIEAAQNVEYPDADDKKEAQLKIKNGT